MSIVKALALLAVLGVADAARAQSAGAFHVALYIEVQAVSTSAGAALVRSYERAAATQPGSVGISAYQETARTNRFLVMEHWQDAASFSQHEKAPATLLFRDKLKMIQRSPPDRRVHLGFAVDPSPASETSGAVYVATHVDVPGARRLEAEALLRPLYDSSLGDPGHVRYDMYQQLDPRMNHFTLFSVWSSRRAFDAYGSRTYSLQFREALAPMLGALYDERVYRRLSTLR